MALTRDPVYYCFSRGHRGQPRVYIGVLWGSKITGFRVLEVGV